MNIYIYNKSSGHDQILCAGCKTSDRRCSMTFKGSQFAGFCSFGFSRLTKRRQVELYLKPKCALSLASSHLSRQRDFVVQVCAYATDATRSEVDSERSAVDTGERASRCSFCSGAVQRFYCEDRTETAKSSKLRSFECHRTALIRSLAASRQDLIVPPRDKARFRASNEAESSCSALIPRLRAPKRSYVTTRYGCHGRSARRTPFLFLLTLNGAPPTSIPSRDICIGPQSMHQFLLSTLYTAASADHRRSTSDLLSPNALSISELQRNRTVGHQVIVTISGVCCLCVRTPATEVPFYLDLSRSSREAGIITSH